MLPSSSHHLKRLQQYPNQWVKIVVAPNVVDSKNYMKRYLSSVKTKEDNKGSKNTSLQFQKERLEYEKNLNSLRKVWSKQHLDKIEMKRKLLEDERRKVVIDKAMRLREKRKESAAKQEAARIEREKAMERYKLHIAKRAIEFEEKKKKLGKKYQKAVMDLEEEKDCWITPKNANILINADLFVDPATTGIKSDDSDEWRYAAYSINIDRMGSDITANRISNYETLQGRVGLKAEAKFTKRLVVEDFLDHLIGSGEERSEYKDLVSKYLATLDEDLGAMDSIDESYSDVSSLPYFT